jgi:hypothetical protein
MVMKFIEFDTKTNQYLGYAGTTIVTARKKMA